MKYLLILLVIFSSTAANAQTYLVLDEEDYSKYVTAFNHILNSDEYKKFVRDMSIPRDASRICVSDELVQQRYHFQDELVEYYYSDSSEEAKRELRFQIEDETEGLHIPRLLLLSQRDDAQFIVFFSQYENEIGAVITYMDEHDKCGENYKKIAPFKHYLYFYFIFKEQELAKVFSSIGWS
jgi:hypothetical protein